MEIERLGEWVFILGVVIAVISGLAYQALIGTPGAEYIGVVLVILGLIVGFLNIRDKDLTPFLIAVIALVAVGAAGIEDVPLVGPYLSWMIRYVAAFVAPAALVCALKAVYNLASTKK